MKPLRLLAPASIAVFAALSPMAADAASRCVNPGGTGSCLSSIQAAIAASAPSGDSITVAAGTYFESNIQLDRSVDISGAGVDVTIVDGGGGPFPVFKYPDFPPSVTATLSNLTVQHGYRGLNIGRFNNVTLDHVRVTGNGPGSGAGIFSNASNLYLNHSLVDHNNAADAFFGCDWSGGSGGGIGSLCGGGSNYISNSTITANTAATWGGGLIVNDGQTIIENSTISGNHAMHPDPNLGGGAIFVGGGFPDVTIRYSTIANNTAVGAGGGLWGADDGGTVRFKVLATLLQGNAGGDCKTFPGVGIKSLGYNIVSDASCPFMQATDLNSTNAMLGPLQDNGGPTATHAIPASSPAVDRIPAADCTVASDQTGVARPQGPTCDSGSFEFVDFTAPTLSAHADVTTEATGPTGATATYALPTATDDLAVASVSCLPVSGSLFPVGDSTVDCSATDTHGNVGHSSIAVHVVDTTPPTVTVPANISVLQASPAGTVVSFTATASDLVDGTFAAVCAPASGSTFTAGNTTVHCTATDAHNNHSGVASFVVHVAGVSEQILSLLALVSGVGPGNSLAAKVALALGNFAVGHPAVACHILDALLHEVQAQAGKKIPVAKAAEITTAVNQIRAALGC